MEAPWDAEESMPDVDRPDCGILCTGPIKAEREFDEVRSGGGRL